ncbi:hypothetical protein T06_3533 [Trichinella sp. T6]|nr:hypothetical protein T06_3533 [Trichinella sp. T6]
MNSTLQQLSDKLAIIYTYIYMPTSDVAKTSSPAIKQN